MVQPEPAGAHQAFQSTERAAAYRRQLETAKGRNQPATDLMLAWAELRPGSHVLDIAAGTGDQTFQIAPRIAPGAVIAIDISANMLAIAAEAAQSAGTTNISTAVMDAQELDFPDSSFDAVVCRLGLMFMADPAKAFREARRVLRPGGKFAAVVVGDADRNPYMALAFSVARRIGNIPEPPTGTPGLFALGGPGVFAHAFHQAGFRDVRVQTVPTPFRFNSVAEAIEDRRTAPAVVKLELLERLTDEQRRRYWKDLEAEFQQFAGPDGFVGPGEQLVGVGTR